MVASVGAISVRVIVGGGLREVGVKHEDEKVAVAIATSISSSSSE